MWLAFGSQDLDWAWLAGSFAHVAAFVLLEERVRSGHELVGAKGGCLYTQGDLEERENIAQVVVDWMTWDTVGIVGSY